MSDAPLPRGITLLDLVTAIPQGSYELFPSSVRRLLENLSVVQSESRASTSFDIVEGTARSLVDVLGVDIGEGFWAELPGVTDGVHFEYASTRVVPAGTQNVEPAPAVWQVAIFVDRIQVPFPGRAAQRAASVDGFVGPLVPDPDRKRSHIWVSGVVLVTNATPNPAGGPPIAGVVTPSIIAPTDPFAPNAPPGQVITAGLEPRHVLFGTSGFGMSLGEIVWDQSTAFTPPEIVARGHDANWRGLSVSDATLALPRDLPFVGDVTAGVRDLLIGFTPDNGVQLEAFLQLGTPPDVDDGDADIVTLHFYQDVDGQISNPETPTGPAGSTTSLDVDVVSTTAGDPVRVLARLDPADASARWRLPGTDTWITANDTGWLSVRPGDPRHTLGFRQIHTLQDGRTADGLERIYAFVPVDDAGDDGGFPPKIAITLDSQDLSTSYTWNDVTHVSGTADQLALMRLDAIEPLPSETDDRDRISWELRHGSSFSAGTGTDFDPFVSWRPGTHHIVLTDHLGRRRRLDVEVLDTADRVIVGCTEVDGTGPNDERSGPRQFIDDGTTIEESAATPGGVVGTYHLRAFHQDGDRRPAADPATIDGTGALTIPDGALAEITIGSPEAHVLSSVRVRMDFDAKTPTMYREIHPVDFTTAVAGFEGTHVDPWGPPDPYPPFPDDGTGAGADRLHGLPEGVDPNVGAASILRAWARIVLDVDPGASFVVVGRTCDIGTEDASGFDAYNYDLAIRRADHAVALLTSADYGADGIDAPIVSRGETEPASSLPPDPTSYGSSSDPELVGRSLAGRTERQFRIKADYPDWETWTSDRGLDQREEARCADIFAVVTYPSGAVVGGGDPDGAKVGPSLRRTLVPGVDQWAVVTELPRERKTEYALRLLAKWDSPSWVDATDSTPTLVEVALDWQTSELEIPALGTGSVEPAPADPNAPDTKLWQVVLRYTRDPRTRQMIVSGALDTPGDESGIARVVDSSVSGSGFVSDLALTLGLGPAIGTAVSSDDADGSLVALGALAGVYAASAIFDIASNGELVLQRLEFGYGRATGGSLDTATRIWMYADYTAGFDVADPLGLVTGTGIVIGYERAGVEFGDDVATASLDGLGIVYDGPAQIVSPGTWTMSNALAKLLGVTAVRMGAGSIWIETDLEMAIELGPITLDAATLRLTLSDPFVFELRGLTLSVDIPGVLHGQGRLAITENPNAGPNDYKLAVSAGLDLTIEPIGLGVDADFFYPDPMVHLEVAVTFATPIPLLNTGLGLYGLNGRFVSNGTRNLPEPAEPDEPIDPVQRELQWLVTPLADKYTVARGQTAIGIGATVGTTTDTGFSFNLNGMLIIEFPDPSVVLTVAGRFMSQTQSAEEDGNPDFTLDAGLLGIVAITAEGLAVGIRGSMEIPNLIEVHIPVAAWFPFVAHDVAAYVRIGSDGEGGRAGEPVTITVLPGTLDLYAWSYLMIEAKEMRTLGGKAGWDFFGFSIGFGAGYDFEWGGSAVYLRAGASIVVGVGTKPLLIKGELTAGGELRFGPVGVAIDGKIGLTLTEADAALEGEFCGEVDLALFKAKGCVNVTVGEIAGPTPTPDPLIAGMDLVDRYARVVATAHDLADTDVSTGPDHTAWVDARPVLHFDKRVIDGLTSTSIQPTPSSGWGADWSGSARTKFLYRLVAVELLDGSGNVVSDAADWPSTWWMPTGRPAIPVEGDAPSSEHEAWDLGLFTWDLAPWARSLPDGGTGSEGDPASMIERLCDPVPSLTPHHVFGADGTRIGVDAVEFVSSSTAPLPWPSSGGLSGSETLGIAADAAQVWADLLAYRSLPGGVIRLPDTFTDPATGDDIIEAWALPGFTHDVFEPITVGFDGVYSADVERPDLVIALSMPVPPSGSEFDVCFEFDDLTGGLPASDPDAPELPDRIDYGIISITGHEGVSTSEGVWYLYFDDQIDVDVGRDYNGYSYGPASRVVAEVEYYGDQPVRMRALDEAGRELAEAVLPDFVSAGDPYELVIEHPGIRRVELWAEPGDPQIDRWLHLRTLCFQMEVGIDPIAYRDAIVEFFEDHATVFAPPCTGTRLIGDATWEPALVDVVATTERVAAIVRYEPPTFATGPWNGVRLDPVQSLDVAIVSSCFTTTSAVDAAAHNSEARDELVDGWNGLFGSGDDWIHLLEADTTYQVRVDYDVATWNQPDSKKGFAAPPSAASLDWSSPPAEVTIPPRVRQTFEFRTAPEATMAEDSLLRYDVQDIFDTRALARYLVGFDPPDPSIPHFLDDKLLVHFEVEWIEALLAEYEHTLRLDVARTDPPPGTTDTYADRLVSTEIGWTSNTSTMHSSMADATMAVAALHASCIDGPQPHGSTACIDADLEPQASYDLIVRAIPDAFPNSDGVVVARTQFTTSRYHDADELYAAMSFDRQAPLDPFFPFEQIATAAGPVDVLLGDDVALDEALASMGLDPLPVADEPTVYVIWIDDGSDWKITGLLVDSHEPLSRPPRLEDILDDSPPTGTITPEAVLRSNALVAVVDSTDNTVADYVEAPDRLALGAARIGADELTPRRSNAASTRVLFGVAAPFVPGAPALHLDWLDRGTTRIASRYASAVPRLVSQELT